MKLLSFILYKECILFQNLWYTDLQQTVIFSRILFATLGFFFDIYMLIFGILFGNVCYCLLKFEAVL